MHSKKTYSYILISNSSVGIPPPHDSHHQISESRSFEKRGVTSKKGKKWEKKGNLGNLRNLEAG